MPRRTAEGAYGYALAGLRKAAQESPLFGTGGGLSEFWNSLGDDTKQTLVNSALGALFGGGLLGGGRYMKDREAGLGGAARSGLVGALLGGLAGGAGTLGYRALTSGRVAPGETVPPATPVDRALDTVARKAVGNIGMTAGGLLGGAASGRAALGMLDARSAGRPWRMPSARTAMALLGLPVGLGAGYIADRYISGDYE